MTNSMRHACRVIRAGLAVLTLNAGFAVAANLPV